MLETKQCPSCGYAVKLISQFCQNCGHSFQAGSWPEVAPPEPPSFAPAPPPTASDAPTIIASQPAPLPPPDSYPPPAPPGFAAPQELPIAATVSPEPAAAMCFQHQSVPAVQRCASCGVNICSTCDFLVPAPSSSNSLLQLGRDMHLCPNCMAARGARATGRPMAGPPAIPLGAGIMCSRHAEVQAIRHCQVCRTPMCQTCDFELPGYFHVCPGCATNPKREMSSGRKRNLILSYILAAWSTLGLALMFAGAFAGLLKSKADQEMYGVVFSFLVFVPSIAGTALGVSSRDRKLANPPAIWVAVIWNSIILMILIILIIIGNLT